jgi:hypothetical protein
MPAHRTTIHRINLQGRNYPLQLPPPGLSNKRIRSRLRATYPYSLGRIAAPGFKRLLREPFYFLCRNSGVYDKALGGLT